VNGPHVVRVEYSTYLLVVDDEYEEPAPVEEDGVCLDVADGHLVRVGCSTEDGRVLVAFEIAPALLAADESGWDAVVEAVFTSPEPADLRTWDRGLMAEGVLPAGTWRLRLHARASGSWDRPAWLQGPLEEHLIQAWRP
jgi:hypothetical protein